MGKEQARETELSVDVWKLGLERDNRKFFRKHILGVRHVRIEAGD